ncbi:MAG: TerB family tellurite resistance protein [Bacteroidetes bacterium]|nr:MAG: TerB family tellurite resistance protein [Bacteroidota bacterium]
MDEKKKETLSLLTELIKFAKADQEYRDSEHRFLLAIAHQLGVSDQEFEQLFKEYIEFTPPKIEIERIVQFQRIILLMNIDQDVDTQELNQARDLGVRMGLRPQAIEQVLLEMKKHENSLIPPEILINIFKVHHN